MWKAAQTWWQSVVVPPRQRPWYFVIYLLVLGAGIYTLWQPPLSIKAEIGPDLTFVWALLLTVGGALGSITVLTKFWELERAALGWIFTGAFMYAAIVLMQHFTSEGSRIPQLAFITIALVVFAKRYFQIRAWTVQPPYVTD